MEIFATNLVAHELLHFLVALMVGFFVWWRFKTLRLVILVFLVSFLIDLDHLAEVFLLHGLNFSLFLFSFEGNLFRESGKMTIFFHSWEVLPVVLFLGKKFQQWPLAVTVVSSAIGHYSVDQFVYTTVYGMSFFQYSLIYRTWHNFSFEELCDGC